MQPFAKANTLEQRFRSDLLFIIRQPGQKERNLDVLERG